MKMKLYLDTSIPSAYFDYSKPVRQLITQKWFENDASSFELYISVITIEEIEKLKNFNKRNKIKELIVNHNVKVLEISSEAIELANEYMNAGAIPQSEPEDAYHIAVAAVNTVETLASWNFKHIVSINPIRKIHEVNRKLKYPMIEIGSLELFGGSRYGNL
ncbi:MAG: type II toxin-antitoxin system VapC family toxin [bacterium]